MFHLNTELLIDYWRDRRGERALPARADIDPADFYSLTPQAFILAREEGEFRFRLAGEAVIDLVGRPLRDQPMADQWRPTHRQPMIRALNASLDSAAVLVVTAHALSETNDQVRIEFLFAPLTGPNGRADRFLGLCQPLSPLSILNGRPVRDLAIHGLNGAEAKPPRAGLRLAALDGRRIA